MTVSALKYLALAAASALTVFAADSTNPAFPPFSGDPFEAITLTAKGINATFIPYGARLTHLFVADKNNVMQDVVLGYDTGKQYLNDSETVHTYFGAVVGRYANRIKNGTFTIDGQTSHIVENEHDGLDTLHGGSIGYDQRNWTVAAQSGNSVTFSFLDEGFEGFPGTVLNVATYTLTDEPAWISRMISVPFDQATPIMLASTAWASFEEFLLTSTPRPTTSTGTWVLLSTRKP